ncbi:MAG: hypothetical protein ACI4S3_07075 [Candidatus Gastranaerophilaceae bacterium]
MNKIQIKAEILTLITKLQTTTAVSDEMFALLDAEEDKQAVMDVLLKELARAKEQKAFVICYMLTRLFNKETLNTGLREFIRTPKINDYAKMVAFNLLRDIGSDIQYDEVNGYFTEFEQIVDEETKELLNTAIMNPEAQIDFMDFLLALPPEEQKILIKSLNEDYSHDALANILIPIFLYNPKSDMAKEVVGLLAESKSQLAFHAFEDAKEFVGEDLYPLINKGLSTLKLAGVRVDNTIEFYKEILKTSKPYRSYISYPDGHGNNAVVFSRKRPDETLQFVAMVINDRYGILDCFGFNEITEFDYNKILDRFFGNTGRVEINERVLKFLIDEAEKLSRYNMDVLPYEYVCWKNIFLDIEPKKPQCSLSVKELTQADIDEVCMYEFVQRWFYDTETSEVFKTFVENLNKEFLNNEFNVDLEEYINKNFDKIITNEELMLWNRRICFAAFLSELSAKNAESQLLLSMQNNKYFLKNIIRKSIYEHYVRLRWVLTNSKNTASIFNKKSEEKNQIGLELMQIDMIISTIENLWVKA